MPLLGRDVSITGPLPKGTLLLETLSGREILGQPYRFKLGLLSEDPKIDPDALLGKPLAVAINLPNGEQRFVHGIVLNLAKAEASRKHTRYEAESGLPLLPLMHHP